MDHARRPPILVIVVLSVSLLTFATGLAARFFVDTATQRLLYAALMAVTGAVGLTAVRLGQHRLGHDRLGQDRLGHDTDRPHTAWNTYARLISVCLLIGAVDAVSPLGDKRIGFLLLGPLGITAVVVFLSQALALRRASTLDRLDAIMLGLTATYLTWWYQASSVPDPPLQIVSVLFAGTGLGFAGLVVLSVRDVGISRTRLLTSVGLALQPLGILLSPGALSGGRYADNLVGSTVTLIGAAALVAAVVVAAALVPAFAGVVTVLPSPDARTGLRERNVAWWLPMAFSMVVVTTHSAIGRQPASGREVIGVIALLGSGTLMAYVVITVRSLRRLGEELEGDRERLRILANTDALTGLANRAALVDHLGTALLTASPDKAVWVLFCDLDRLKAINDSLGHDVGDAMICATAQRWAGLLDPDVQDSDVQDSDVQDSDVQDSQGMVARLGGDEFVVTLTATGTQATALADSMHQVLRRPMEVQGHALTARTSIGAAVAISPEVSTSELLGDADAALYRAKDAGGGCTVVFDIHIRFQVERRLELQEDLRRTINDKQIEVHLQPVLDVRTHTIVAVESRLHWAHPTLGAIGPDETLQVAEDAGLSVRLGDLVLDRSCAALRQIWDAGHHVPSVWVPITAAQLVTPGASGRLEQVLRQYDLPPHALTLEVFGNLQVDHRQTAEVLSGLAATGVQLSLDGLGTGAAVLPRTHGLVAQQLRMNLKGLGGLDGDATSAVISGILGVASVMGLSVVAQGLQDDSQVAMVTSLGCVLVQGSALMPRLSIDQLLTQPLIWAEPQRVAAGSPPR